MMAPTVGFDRTLNRQRIGVTEKGGSFFVGWVNACLFWGSPGMNLGQHQLTRGI